MKMRCLNVLMWCFFQLTMLQVSAQYANNWCLGDSVRLNFDTSPPGVFHDVGMAFHEPMVSISDDEGQLLFYANQDQVFDRHGNLMLNGNGPFAGSKSYTQGMLAIQIGEAREFLLVYLSNDCPSLGRCIRYSVIDLEVADGSGSLRAKHQLLYAQPNVLLSEKLQAIRHANGRDWWVITQTYGSNQFLSFLLSGKANSEVRISEVGQRPEWWYGQMKASHQGDRIATVTGGLVEVLNFDRCTGAVSTPISLGDSTADYYGCSFSPSGRFLYVSTWHGPANQLFQFDLMAVNIPASKVLIWESNAGDKDEIGQHQLGPDGKIYLSHNLSTFFVQPGYSYVNQHISVIHQPEAPGLACDFRPHSLAVGPERTSFGLPNIPRFDLEPLALPPFPFAGADQDICEQEAVRLGSPARPGFTYSWLPTEGLSDASSPQPIARPSQSTTYVLTMIDPTRSCRNLRRDTVVLNVFPCKSLQIPNVFTPNGDGVQDIFKPYDDFGTEVLSLRIYNRWGQEIFSSRSAASGWNGSLANGEHAPEGSYFYWLRYRNFTQVVREQRGSLMLLR